MNLETLLQLTNNIVTLKNSYPIVLTMDMIDMEATKKLIPRMTIEEWKAKYDPIRNDACENYYIFHSIITNCYHTERAIPNNILGSTYFSTQAIAEQYIEYLKAVI